jgi:5-methylthioadenosine/S-adenosylhomocysteine deaminase
LEIDTLIHADWVIPGEPLGAVMARHSLAIADGRILEVLPTPEAREKYRAPHTHQLDRHLLIPGLVNTHTHAAMALLRGLADDLPLMTWLHDHIWPAEQRWVSEEFVHDGTQLAMAEMLRSGTTCFNDMYFFPDVAGRAVAAAGMRATIGLIVVDFPTPWAENADEYLHRGLEVHDQFRNHALVRTAFAPHAPYSVSDEPLERTRTLADELDIPIHIHVHETRDEIMLSLQHHGVRPLERLRKLDMVSPSLVAVHLTHLEEDEIQVLAEAGAHGVHCPESNLKLTSGLCQVDLLGRAGVNMALGTDGPASNNDLNLIGEMRTAAMLGKLVADDPSALPAAQVLSMATLNGARALGIDERIGSLKAGKEADVVAVHMGEIETQPVYDPLSHLVYATGRHQVRHVWVSGRQLLRDRQLTTLDTESILAHAQEWGPRIRAHASAGGP